MNISVQAFRVTLPSVFRHKDTSRERKRHVSFGVDRGRSLLGGSSCQKRGVGILEVHPHKMKTNCSKHPHFHSVINFVA